MRPCSHIRTCYTQTSVPLLYRDPPNPARFPVGESRHEVCGGRRARVQHVGTTSEGGRCVPAGHGGFGVVPGRPGRGSPRLRDVSVDSSGGARRIAALITGVQALVLAGLAVFYLYELSVGAGSDASGVAVSALLIGGTAVALLVLTKGWLGDGEWPRTPTVVVNLLLLPVGWSLAQAGRTTLGWTVLAVGLLATVVAFSTRPDVVAGEEGPDQGGRHETDGRG